MAIDEKKLIEDIVTTSLFKLFYQTEYEIGMEVRQDEIIKIINKQPKLDVPDTNVGKWIPCSERLPDETGWYLCTLKGEAIEWDRFNTTNKQWWSKAVVAWMPLPEAYKGDE